MSVAPSVEARRNDREIDLPARCRLRHRAVRLRHADPGVFPRIQVPGGPERGPVVVHQADVQVGVDGPGLEGAEDFEPGGVRAKRGAAQEAADAGDGRPVRGEAQGQVAAVQPRLTERGRDGAVFQSLQA